MSIIKILFFGLLLQFCSTSIYCQTDLSIEHINAELMEKANSIVRYQNTEVHLNAINKIETHFSTAITVLNKNAADELDLVIAYKESSDKIKDLFLEIINEKGRVIGSFKKSDFDDQSLYDGVSMITDYRGKIFSYEAYSYPVTLKYEYRLISQSTSYVRGFYPINNFRQAVEKASYKLNNIPNIEIFTKENLLDAYGIEKLNRFHFVAKNLKAITHEKYAPAIAGLIPYVDFFLADFNFESYQGSAKSWNELGMWYYNTFLHDRNEFDETEVAAELKQFIKEDASVEEKIKQTYQFVQDNTRYISIALKEGGLSPMKVSDVHKLKYGDCKALSFYTQSLLELQGIASNYVLIQAGDRKESFDEEFFSLEQGNHAVINVPLENDTIWLECTSGINPAGFLGSFTDDRKCLEINEDGGRIVSTPRYSIEENYSNYNANILADEGGNVNITLSNSFNGLSIDNKLGLKDLNQDDFNEYFEEYLFPNVKNIKILDKHLHLDETALNFNEEITFEAEGYMEQAGPYLLAPIDLINLKIPNLPNDHNRLFPIKFERSFRIDSELNYVLPDDYVLKNKPDNIELESPYGKYQISFDIINLNEVKVNKSFSLFEAQYEASKYDEIKSFFDNIRIQENKELLFAKK